MTIYQPYFYVIQDIRNGMYYAGAKWAHGASPSTFMIEGGYTTSSETIKELILQHGLENFVIRKMRIFDLAEDAQDYETLFLRKVNARSNSKFYNAHNNDGAMDPIKMKIVMMEIYGVDNAFKSEEIKSKIRNKNLELYGVEYVMQSKIIREKSMRTLVEKYGVDNYSKTEEFKAKYSDKMMKNYGVDHYSKTEEFRNTISEKYVGNGNPAFGKRWYTNDETSVLCFEHEVPDGFRLGAQYGKSGEDNSFFGKTHSEEAKIKISAGRKGKPPHNKGRSGYKIKRSGKWINNGCDNKLLKEGDQIPDGFVFGLLLRK